MNGLRRVPAVGVTESEKGERILVGVTDPVAGAAMANLREGEEAKRVKRKEVNRVLIFRSVIDRLPLFCSWPQPPLLLLKPRLHHLQRGSKVCRPKWPIRRSHRWLAR